MTLGWIDFSTQHHQQLRAALDRLGERGVLDELKLGRIRDSIADDLFPGIATPHTRSKYLFLVPWVLRDVAQNGKYTTPQAYVEEVHRREVQMIKALVKGSADKTTGIIGQRAGASLQQKPSATYWSALKAYGLIEGRGSLRDFARRNFHHWKRKSYEAGFGATPSPHPADWKKSLDVRLTPEEASRLSGYVIGKTKESLLAWLLALPADRVAKICQRPAATDLIGEEDLPAEIRSQLLHARHYELLFRPALLLYNQELLKINADYDQELLTVAWEDYATERFHLLDNATLTAELLSRYKVDPATRRFIVEWSHLVLAGAYRSPEAVTMIKQREATVKPGRARLTDKSLARKLEAGETPGIYVAKGEGAALLFNYRWGNVIQHLRDLKLRSDA